MLYTAHLISRVYFYAKNEIIVVNMVEVKERTLIGL